MSKVVIGLIGIALLLIVFPLIMVATHELQVDEVTTAADNVTTEVDVTSAGVTLDYALWQGEVDSVVSISSNATESPAETSYAPVTKALTVGSLSENTTRTLTVLYETDALVEFTGLGALVSVAPLLIFIGILGMCIGGIYLGVRAWR